MIKNLLLLLLMNILTVSTFYAGIVGFGLTSYLIATGLTLTTLASVAVFWGMGVALLGLFCSRFIAKLYFGVKVIDTPSNENERRLVHIVKDLYQKAGLAGTPEIGVFKSNVWNAFATGYSSKKALVAVSSSLLEGMEEKELRGVLAHEVAHIQQGHVITRVLLEGNIKAYTLFLGPVIARLLYNSSRSKQSKPNNSQHGSEHDNREKCARCEEREIKGLSKGIEKAITFFGSLLILKYSRMQEYEADQKGADLLGIEGASAVKAGLERLHVHVGKEKPFWPWFANLISTHPPLEDRIDRMKKREAEEVASKPQTVHRRFTSHQRSSVSLESRGGADYQSATLPSSSFSFPRRRRTSLGEGGGCSTSLHRPSVG